MEPNLEKRLAAIEQKMDAMYASVEKARKYFLWLIIITVAVTVLPLLGALTVIPSFLDTYTQSFEGL